MKQVIKSMVNKSSMLIVILVTMLSCSEDSPFVDPYGNNPNNQDTGPKHTYEMSFTGGNVDGDNFSGSFPDNMIVAYRHQISDGEGGEIDTITLSLAEESQANDFSLGMLIRMNGDVPKPLNESDDDNESHMVISYDDYIMNATSGSITMTNLGQMTYQGVVYPHFKITYTAEMNGSTPSNPNAFTTQVSGTIIVRQLDVN